MEMKMVEYACVNKKCGQRKEVSNGVHMLGLRIMCPSCHRQMIYRKDL